MEFRQKPLVYGCHLPDLFNAVPTVECTGYCKDTIVGGIDKFFVDIIDEIILQGGSQKGRQNEV